MTKLYRSPYILYKGKIVNFLLFLLFSALYAHTSHAIEFNSGKNKVRLIELYTSQSCSSCPPAEAWLSRFKSSKGLWTKFIPISYHVSYWNHLHWKDTFSKEEFSLRQRNYHQVIQGGVYTPQIVLDGKDFRGWRRIRNISQLEINKMPGNLSVLIDQKYKTAQLNFTSNQTKDELICFGAYLESGHPTKVTSGENSGRRLDQDFVVINLSQSHALKKGNQYSCKLDIQTRKVNSSVERGLAFWLINKKTYQVIQATGGKMI